MIRISLNDRTLSVPIMCITDIIMSSMIRYRSESDPLSLVRDEIVMIRYISKV